MRWNTMVFVLVIFFLAQSWLVPSPTVSAA